MSENKYAIMRFAKYKGPEISRIEAHNERTKEIYASNPDIDRSRSQLNFNLIYPPQHYRAEAEKQIGEAGCRVRSDSIRLVEVLFAASTGFFDGKSDEEVRAYYERTLEFLKAHQDPKTIVSAVVHMDEGTPHMHVTFVPLTQDNRLSAKDIIGNRKKLIQWQDHYYEYMTVKYPDLSRGESAVRTGRKHMDTKEFKTMTREIRKMTALSEKIGSLMNGTNMLNAKGRLEEIVPLIRKLLPRISKMKVQLEQYGETFTKIKDENIALKEANEKLIDEGKLDRQELFRNEVTIQELHSHCRRLEQKLKAIPPEITAQYGIVTPVLEKQR